MIQREELLEYMEKNLYKPVTVDELAEQLSTAADQDFYLLLQEMEDSGDIVKNRKGRYGLPQRMNLNVGRLQGHAKGFAFLIPDNLKGQDIFISSENLNGAMHNDRVIVRLNRNLDIGRKREGKVIRILKRANQQVVGTFAKSRNFGFVVPDDKRLGQDIFIPKNEMMDAKEGDKVVAEIIQWPEARRSPEGKVIEVLGHKDQPGTDILSIVRKFQLPEAFPTHVLSEAEKYSLSIDPEELKKRKDLRQILMVTIDGEDAKDLDDAVSLEIMPNGNYYLGVHIADVGYYVKEDSELDKEALRRATSVYLVDRVIPMLPPHLSNGICSLNPQEDRLTMSCFMEINGQGEVVDYEIAKSIINVNERMTYKNVRKILIEEDRELITRYSGLVDMFHQMKELCQILRGKRFKRGSIDFNFPESKVIIDNKGKPLDIIKREHTIAEMIIEEFMICANETVATHYHFLRVPFLYRVHEEPSLDDIGDLNEFIGAFGYHIRVNSRGEVHPRAFQQVVEKVKDRPEEKAVNTVLLRSMKHACYAPEAIGHFGLASDYYSHFTSPIRRYPDLAIHRVIGEISEKGLLSDQRKQKLAKLMHEYAKQSSLQERVAEDAERESVELKKVEYMKGFMGETFKGTISSVTSFGFFVELPNTVEGLVHVSTLNDDYYLFVEKNLMLVGEHTKRVFRIGDIVDVVLVKVDIEERKIDFELANHD